MQIVLTADTRLIYTTYYVQHLKKSPIGPYIVRDLKHEQKDKLLADLIPGKEIQNFTEANYIRKAVYRSTHQVLISLRNHKKSHVLLGFEVYGSTPMLWLRPDLS